MKYGLQIDFLNKLMQEYFGGITEGESLKPLMYLGLGLPAKGADENLSDFNEVNKEGYERALVMFRSATDGMIKNYNDVLFNPALESWTEAGEYIESLGVFDTLDRDADPIVVLKLARGETVGFGESLSIEPETLELELYLKDPVLHDQPVFKLSNTFLNYVLDATFGADVAVDVKPYPTHDIYLGLGITFDPETFTFIDEPVSKGFTILDTPVAFSAPINGIIKNEAAIMWPKAEQNWCDQDSYGNARTIKYIGLYYNKSTTETPEYELIGILPLSPEETVGINEMMVLNANSVQIRLTNL